MSINAADLPDYTDADLLKIYRWGLANGAAGTTRSINGRSVTFPEAAVMMDIITQLENRIAAAGGGLSALAREPGGGRRRGGFPLYGGGW
jgi:hypothetical protein